MIWRYIHNCHTCRLAKTPGDQYNDLLKFLLILSSPSTHVTLDFVTYLSISYSLNAVLMMIDCLTKEKHYILCITDKKKTNTEAIDELLLQTFENFIVFCYLLLPIETLCLFLESEKISARLLVFLLAYLHHFIYKQIDKVRLSMKKWKSIFTFFFTINKITC